MASIRRAGSRINRMQWPFRIRPVPDSDVPLWHVYYLGACRAPSDPTMIWGTDFDASGLEAYLREVNRHSPTLVSPAHVLLRAVGCALRRHPELNRRIVGTRIHDYKQINLMMPVYDRRRAQSRNVVIERVDERPLPEVASEMWRLQQLILHEPERGAAGRLLDRVVRAVSRHMIPLYLWTANKDRKS